MALTDDLIQATPVLVDEATGEGIALSKALEGEAILNKNAQGAFVAKDGSDQFAYLKVNSNGSLVTTEQQGAEACVKAVGKVNGSQSEQTVCEITLTAGLEYKQLGFVVSCFRASEFRIVAINEPTGQPAVKEELATLLVGPNQYTQFGELKCLTFTANANNPVLRIVGTNVGPFASDLRATLTATEVQ